MQGQRILHQEKLTELEARNKVGANIRERLWESILLSEYLVTWKSSSNRCWRMILLTGGSSSIISCRQRRTLAADERAANK